MPKQKKALLKSWNYARCALLYARLQRFPHTGRMIQSEWFRKGKVKVIPTTAEKILKSHGYEVLDVNQFLNPPRKKEEIKIIGLFDKELPRDKRHPDYKCEPCFIYKNENVLIEGLEQAKVLTNTVEICEGLPEPVIDYENKLDLPETVHLETKKKIKLCCLFDAVQEALPKKKDPLRPAWVFPREYGIPETRKNNLLCKNLSAVCEQFTQNMGNKAVIFDALFSTPFVAHNKKIQFELMSELVVTTRKKIRFMAEPSSTNAFALPEMGPMDCTISLKPHNFYTIQDIYPPGPHSKWPYVQAAFLHFNPTHVKNIIEEEVTESQIQERSLLSGFSIALAEARAMYGGDVKKLPEPIVVPVVQTDGKLFHFAIFQLNTLDLNKNSEVKNIFWNSQRIPLYSVCEYQTGRPVLEGYNPDVIRRLISFYNLE